MVVLAPSTDLRRVPGVRELSTPLPTRPTTTQAAATATVFPIPVKSLVLSLGGIGRSQPSSMNRSLGQRAPNDKECVVGAALWASTS